MKRKKARPSSADESRGSMPGSIDEGRRPAISTSTEQALRERELFLTETARLARLCGWKANPHTDYLEWTDGVYDILEAPRDYRPGLAEGLKFFLPEYIPVLAESIARCLATGERFCHECRVATVSGKVLWTEVRGLASGGGGDRSYVVGTFQDIHERKQAEESLRLAYDRRNLIARVTATVVGSASLAEQARDLAEQVRAAFGADACIMRTLEGEELELLACVGAPRENVASRLKADWGISKELIDRRQPLFVADVHACPTTAAAIGRMPNPYRFLSYAGTPLLVSDHVVGILGVYWVNGCRHFGERDLEDLQTVAGNVAVSIVNERLHREVASQRDRLEADVAERKRAAWEKEYLQEQLLQSQKMEAVGQLASGVIHDFNNLLTVIRGDVTLIERALPPDLRVALGDKLAGILEAADQAVRTTRSLLTFARKVPTEKRRISLGETAQRTTRMLRRVLPAAIELVVDVASEPPIWIYADDTQVQQIIMNLAVNARDAMPEGGTLRIAVSAAAGAEEDSDTAPAGNDEASLACLTVTDTGTGMSPELQARIFEPFFSTKPRGSGTGLGLSIIQSIVKEHFGRIEVDSAEGRGTTFRVFFPRTEPAAEVATVYEAASLMHGQGEQVLLAEDDGYVLAVVATSLQAEGFDVIQAETGPSLLEKYRRHPESIRLFLFDMDLPGRSGLDCLRELRAQGCRIPAILMTGSGAADPAQSLPAETCLLRKPFGLMDLLRLISSAIGPKSDVQPPT